MLLTLRCYKVSSYMDKSLFWQMELLGQGLGLTGKVLMRSVTFADFATKHLLKAKCLLHLWSSYNCDLVAQKVLINSYNNSNNSKQIMHPLTYLAHLLLSKSDSVIFTEILSKFIFCYNCYRCTLREIY